MSRKNKNQETYVPIVPDIVDETMKGGAEHQEETTTQGKKSKDCEKNTGNSRVRIVGIILLVCVIVVLVILLIYQVYKYCTTEAPVPVDPKRHSVKETKTPQNNNNQHEIKPKQENILPQEVRDLDNDILGQFIKKGNNSETQRESIDLKNKNSARVVEHSAMVGNSVDYENEKDIEYTEELKRLEELTERSINSSNNPVIGEESETLREDMKKTLLEDMEKDKSSTMTLDAITEENKNNILNMLEESDTGIYAVSDDDDTASTVSDNGGCDFELTKGKNKGHTCGRRRVNGIRCSRHVNK